MAKPMPQASTDGAGCSYTANHNSFTAQEYPTRPRRRRSRASPPTAHRALPSSALLSLLATIAASSVGVEGYPTPPSFLCPSLNLEATSIDYVVPRAEPPPDPVRFFPSPTDQQFRRHVPDKYEKGEDGRWRRVTDEYSLYGSTVCPVSLSAPRTLCHLMNFFCRLASRRHFRPSTIRFKYHLQTCLSTAQRQRPPP